MSLAILEKLEGTSHFATRDSIIECLEELLVMPSWQWQATGIGEAICLLRADCDIIDAKSETRSGEVVSVFIEIDYRNFNSFEYGDRSMTSEARFHLVRQASKVNRLPQNFRGYTTDELIEICRRAMVPQEKWSNRDSPGAQQQIGRCYGRLKAGENYEYDGTMMEKSPDTIWLEFDGGETYYLPTPARLDETKGGDWY